MARRGRSSGEATFRRMEKKLLELWPDICVKRSHAMHQVDYEHRRIVSLGLFDYRNREDDAKLEEKECVIAVLGETVPRFDFICRFVTSYNHWFALLDNRNPGECMPEIPNGYLTAMAFFDAFVTEGVTLARILNLSWKMGYDFVMRNYGERRGVSADLPAVRAFPEIPERPLRSLAFGDGQMAVVEAPPTPVLPPGVSIDDDQKFWRPGFEVACYTYGALTVFVQCNLDIDAPRFGILDSDGENLLDDLEYIPSFQDLAERLDAAGYALE